MIRDQKCIGGSDAGDVLGVGFHSPLYLWERLRGITQPVQDDEADQLLLGQYLEEGIARTAERKYGTVIRPWTIGTVSHASNPRLTGNPDGVDDHDRIVSIKLTGRSKDWGDEGTDQIPLRVVAQELHYLGILRSRGQAIEEAVVYVAFTPLALRRYVVRWDEVAYRSLRTLEERMLRMADEGIAPDPLEYEQAGRCWAARRGTPIEATSDIAEAAARAYMYGKIRRRAEELEKSEKLAIALHMRDATDLTQGGEVIATWRADREFDAAAFAIAHPDLAAEYSKTVIDTTRLRKEHRKDYEAFLVEPPRERQVRKFAFKEGKLRLPSFDEIQQVLLTNESKEES